MYAAVTARSHDLPGALVKLLAGLCWLAGIDAAADGPLLVVQSMRQPHRLAISWDMVFDPATLMFLVGGLAWITIDAGRRIRSACGGPNGAGLWAVSCSIVAAWLPIRAIVLLALYLHRASGERVEPAAARDEPVPLAVGAAGHARSSDPAGLAMGARCWAMFRCRQRKMTATKPSRHDFQIALSRPSRQGRGEPCRNPRPGPFSTRMPPGRFRSSIWPRPLAACSARSSSPSDGSGNRSARARRAA